MSMTSTEAVYLLEVKWVLPLVVMVGCWSDEPGLHLEIRAGMTGATRIELYLATRPCAGCKDLLKPEGARNKLPGAVWLLDGDTTVKTLTTSYQLTGGKVVVDLLPPDVKDVDVQYIVAVGYDDNTKVVGVAKLQGITIPAAKGTYWKIALDDAADQASSPALEPEGNRVWVWRRPATATSMLAACVGIEESDGKTITRTWLVPEDDTDCDGVAVECDRFSYLAAGTTDFDTASCVTAMSPQPGLPPTTCLLGGEACTDGSTDTNCGPVLPYYCGPNLACANPTCREDLSGCVTAGVITHLKIVMPSANDTNTRCSNTPAQYVAHVDLTPLVPVTIGVVPTTCTGVKFAKLELGSVVVEPAFTPNGAEFTVGEFLAPCRFSFTWADGAPSNPSNFTFMDLSLSNGTHVMLPVRVDIEPGACAVTAAANAMLHIAPNDLITSCASVPKL